MTEVLPQVPTFLASDGGAPEPGALKMVGAVGQVHTAAGSHWVNKTGSYASKMVFDLINKTGTGFLFKNLELMYMSSFKQLAGKTCTNNSQEKGLSSLPLYLKDGICKRFVFSRTTSRPAIQQRPESSYKFKTKNTLLTKKLWDTTYLTKFFIKIGCTRHGSSVCRFIIHVNVLVKEKAAIKNKLWTK